MKSLTDIVGEMRSACSFYEARGQEQFAAPIRYHIPDLETLAGCRVTFSPSSALTTGAVAQALGWTPATVARKARAGAFSSAVTLTDGTWRIPSESVRAFLDGSMVPEIVPELVRPIGLAPMSNRKEGFNREQFVAPFRSSTSTGRVT